MSAQTLLVVIDPVTDDQMALRRAVSLALETQAQLHLFCCTYLTDDEMGSFSSRKDAKHTQVTSTKQWLEELAEPVRAQGIKVRCEVVWNQKWEVMVAQSAGRIGAKFVVKTSFKHSKLERALRRTSDIYLMRTSPCPVLLVKADDDWQNGIVVAAISLEDGQSSHDQLNNKIVSQAQQLANATKAELHLVSAVHHSANLRDLFQLTDSDDHPPAEMVAQRFGVATNRVHLVDGAAIDVIPDSVQKLHADLLVMGTVARTGLAATVLGNTAEKVLDQLSVDLFSVS
ncbi:universal stress protein [Simiduia sp. 21SJ11W-1]|uniref:universal stress protein n=1 Tax=Simiduia sp. 21SJ11W-1 TaxID=2909669 RepID=UPI00209D64CE|nr:universal stress protein [Simiduia sp. 21SJ11W-1]UTA48022.1 universal stress protein [Simiduia sp. 21SJ11W-1]